VKPQTSEWVAKAEGDLEIALGELQAAEWPNLAPDSGSGTGN